MDSWPQACILPGTSTSRSFPSSSRKGVHVRPQQHRPPGLRSLQEGGNAASGDEPPWNTQGIEAFPNDPHGFLQVEIQLRTGVKPPADGDEIFKKGIFPIVFFFHSVHSPSAPPFYQNFPEGKSALFALTGPSSTATIMLQFHIPKYTQGG